MSSHEPEVWSTLERDLAGWLRAVGGPQLTFRGPNQALPGFPSGGFRSDGCLTNGDVLIALEVEAGQTHPDTNVGKYWLLADTRRYEKIFLFQVYTPRFNSYGTRLALAQFYVERMCAEFPIVYTLLDHRRAVDYGAVLGDVRSQVEMVVRREFANEIQTHD